MLDMSTSESQLFPLAGVWPYLMPLSFNFLSCIMKIAIRSRSVVIRIKLLHGINKYIKCLVQCLTLLPFKPCHLEPTKWDYLKFLYTNIFLETLWPENVNPILPELFLRVPRAPTGKCQNQHLSFLGSSLASMVLPLTPIFCWGTPVSVCDSCEHPLLWPLEEATPFLFPSSTPAAKLCLTSRGLKVQG